MNVASTLSAPPVPRPTASGPAPESFRRGSAMPLRDSTGEVEEALRLRQLSDRCPAWRDGCPGLSAALRRRAAAARYAGTHRPVTAPDAETLRHRLEGARTLPVEAADAATLELSPLAPKRMVVAWRVAADRARALLQRIDPEAGGAVAPLYGVRAFVRFFDVTDRAYAAGDPFFDIPVDYAGGGGARVVDFWTAGRAYTAELWLQRREGAPAAAVASSSRVALPREVSGAFAPSDADLSWIKNPAPRPEKSEFDILAELAREDALRDDSPDRDPETEAVVRALYRGLATVGARVLRQAPPMPYRTPEERRDAYAHRQRMKAAPVRTRARSVAPVSPTPADGFWMARLDRPVTTEVVAAASALLYPPAPFAARSRADEEVVAPVAGRAFRKPAAKPAAVEVVARCPVPAESATRSDEVQEELTLSVEVVLRGRVRPGRRVRVGGRPVPVSADGSFRLSLPWREGMRLPVAVAAARGGNLLEKTLRF